MKRALFLFLALIFCNGKAMACTVADVKRSIPADELINRTKNIVLVRVIKAEYLEPVKPDESGKIRGLSVYEYIATHRYYPVKYTFEVLDLIKGEAQKFFSKKADNFANPFMDFNHHQDEEFWKNEAGSIGPCSMDEPSFVTGAVYLMFLDKPYHRKSFELIRNYMPDKGNNRKDKWLSYVESKVAKSP